MAAGLKGRRGGERTMLDSIRMRRIGGWASCFVLGGVIGATVPLVRAVEPIRLRAATMPATMPTSRPAAPAAGSDEAEIQRLEAAKDAAGLKRAAAGRDSAKRPLAFAPLARVAPDEARPILLGAIKGDDDTARMAAIKAFPLAVDPTDPAQILPIERLVKQSRDKPMVLAALAALGQAYAWDSLESVFQRMNDNDRDIRAAAIKAGSEIMYLRLESNFHPADPPEKRLAAIASLRRKSQAPGTRERYMEWLAEQRREQRKQ